MDSCVSDSLKRQVQAELQELEAELRTFRPMITRSRRAVPRQVNAFALAALLQSFYNGIENIFKRIILESGEALPHGEMWHQDLLKRMAMGSEKRRAVLSEEMWMRLLEYLRFRHFFRQAYSHHLNWGKMKPLVHSLEETYQLFRDEIQKNILSD